MQFKEDLLDKVYLVKLEGMLGALAKRIDVLKELHGKLKPKSSDSESTKTIKETLDYLALCIFKAYKKLLLMVK